MCHKYIAGVGSYKYLVDVGRAALHTRWYVVGVDGFGMCYAAIAGAVDGVVIDLVVLQMGREYVAGTVAIAIELYDVHSIDGAA